MSPSEATPATEGVLPSKQTQLGPQPPSTAANLRRPPSVMEEEGFDDNATVYEDEKFTQERYEEIQAKTMWEMTDDVNDGKQRFNVEAAGSR